MPEVLQQANAAMQERFGADVEQFRDEITLFISPQHIIEAAAILRDEFQFNMLVDLTAVDYWQQQTPRFHVVYQLYSMTHNAQLRLRCPVDGNSPHQRTLEGIYPNANWYEREVFDMFGIIFDGHSDPRRIVMPADWLGHPLRKDYPLGYEEVQFTFNFDEIMAKKPHGKLEYPGQDES
jgi:NADH-quinone oxidoreductase subunit C